MCPSGPSSEGARPLDEQYEANVKVGACYCQHAYEISFLPNTRDVYGKDVDLRARLQGMAGTGEIVMNSDFVNKVKIAFNATGNKEQFSEVKDIQGPFREDIRGFANKIDVYRLPR